MSRKYTAKSGEIVQLFRTYKRVELNRPLAE